MYPLTVISDRGARRTGAPCCLFPLFFLALLLLPLLAGCKREAQAQLPPPKLVSQDPWRLTINQPGPARAYLGNGYLGINASQEGLAMDGMEALPGYVSGYYVNEAFAPAPQWCAPAITINDRRLSAADARDYEQVFDLRRGVLQTRYRWRGRPNVAVEITLFPARQDPHLGVLQVSLTPRRRCTVTIADPAARASGCALRTVDTAAVAGHEYALPHGAIQLRARERWTFTRYAGVCARRDAPDPARVATDTAAQASRQGFAALLRAHEAAWAKLWARDVAINGDAGIQQRVNACRYYLLASVREGRADSVPPMGLSSGIYQGHIFWDADTWIFPVLIPQYPELARSLVEYRYRTLPAARANARRQGLPGADYAWESAESGKETVAGEFSQGRHVTADVALAQWQYYLWTGDRQWLKTRGFPVLRATADYWTGRARRNPANGRYEIRDVMGPDETRGPVNNNAWTNAMAQANLEAAAHAARLLGEPANPRWLPVARGLWIPFDKKNGRYLQCEGYDGVSHKQADCELLLYPRRLPMPAGDAARTFDYYKSRVSKYGPAMTASIYAVIAAQLGRRQEAAAQFRASYEPFLLPPYYLFSEKRTSPRACFITGIAGSLQSIFYGFAGMEPTECGLKTRALLPPGWKGLRLTGVQWHGQTRDVTLAP